MTKDRWALVIGAVMVIGGLGLYAAFLDVETPVVGLRQAGLVIAVLGVVEIAVTAWSMLGSQRRHD